MEAEDSPTAVLRVSSPESRASRRVDAAAKRIETRRVDAAAKRIETRRVDAAAKRIETRRVDAAAKRPLTTDH
ncbi:MAG: hypothetical protein L6306_02590 [Planctomycetales bacterium]|nr:hypothetical protein [Planctomycetales bacterium]